MRLNCSGSWKLLAIVGKLSLSLLVGLATLVILSSTTAARRLVNGPIAGNSPAKADRGPASPANGEPQVAPNVPWPHFPTSAAPRVKESALNGVRIISEEWETTAVGSSVIAYYKEQMAARGWKDVTEETYGIQPDLRSWGMSKNGLQDQQYLALYSAIIDRNLVLNRGDWCMHVVAEPSRDKLGGSAVKIYVAATPSLKQFFSSLAADFSGAGGGKSTDRAIDAVQVSGGQRYHTTLRNEPVEPERAFQDSLARFRADGWRPVVMLPSEQKGGELSVWLEKGMQYGILMAKPKPRGLGSVVTLTEVTPDQIAR